MTEDTDLIRRYFAAFDAGDPDGMLAVVSQDVVHHPNQGAQREGRAAFAAFLTEMDAAYAEQTRDLALFQGPQGRVAAEFTIHGQYLQTQEGLPPATGQRYVLPVGSFFQVAQGRIQSVRTYYNLADWLAQVGA